MATEEVVSAWTLTVTVLRAEDVISQDYWSESDCYVTVCLASTPSSVCRTDTVNNSRNPEWNQAFSLTLNHTLKKTVEIKLYDEDPMKNDNLISSLTIDSSKLTVGKKTTKEFPLDAQGKLWMAFELQESKKIFIHHLKPLMKKTVPHWILNVTVLRAETTTSKDYLSESDCYVILSLPTATARMYRTKTISNNNNPEWNQTFTFRVPSYTKNVLELQMYDEDPLARDDRISTLFFDVRQLKLGQKITKTFCLDCEGKTEDKLLVDFELLQSDDSACEYLTNGTLVGAPFSVLDINVDKLVSSKHPACKVMKLKGAFDEERTIDSKEKDKIRYYINRDLESELKVAPEDDTTAIPESSVNLQPLPAKFEGKVSLVLDQDTVDLDMQTHEGEDEFLAVRLDFDIPPQEKEFQKKRKVAVAPALRKLLGLGAEPGPEQVPTIALVGSGGGTRAMTGLLGSVRGLKALGFVDVVAYITGVSGSTWAMSTLYQDPNWSRADIDAMIAEAEEHMTKSVMSLFSVENMSYYRDEMAVKGEDGYTVSFIDTFGLMAEQLVFGKKVTSTLSEQQATVNEGQNPLPIYTAVNMKDRVTGCEAEAEWVEFTPYEVGLSKYGAFVQTEVFGSEFFLGHIVKKLPEVRLPYLIGIWSSAISVSLTELWSVVTGSKPSWIPWQGPEVNNIDVDTKPSSLDTIVVNPATSLANTLTGFFKNRPALAEMYNFMRGLFLHWDYNEQSNFVAWKASHPDAFPNKLTPSDPTLTLVDSGHAINSAFLPLLRPERDVDLIVSLNYSWDPGHIHRVLEKTAAYCKDHKIPFPKEDFESLEKEPEKEVYVFDENPEAPIIVHFPLVNVSYKDFKSPGVKRETEDELKAGKVDVVTGDSPYTTNNMTYTRQDYEALLDLTTYNIINNKDTLLGALASAMKKKVAKQRETSQTI